MFSTRSHRTRGVKAGSPFFASTAVLVAIGAIVLVGSAVGIGLGLGLHKSSSSSSTTAAATVPCSGLSDSTACLNALFQSSQQITFPPNNVVLKCNASLALRPNTYFDGNGVTLKLTTPNWPAYQCFTTVNSNSSIYNVIFQLSISSTFLGVCLSGSSTSIDIGNITVFASFNSIGLSLGDAVRNVSIHDSLFYGLSYSVFINPSSTSASNDVQNVRIYNNRFLNNTLEGVLINQAVVFGTDQPSGQFDPWLVPFNILIDNNTFTNITGTGDSAGGFCISVAGGKQINITNNKMSGCTWQGIHLEDTAGTILVANNSIDWIYRYPNSSYWMNLIDGIWMGNVQNVTITGNTFSRIPNNAIEVNAALSVTTAGNGAAIPLPYQYSYGFTIIGNTFKTWSGTAIVLGDVPGQNLQSYVAGNVYNGTGTPFSCVDPLGITFLDPVPSSCIPVSRNPAATLNLIPLLVGYLPLVSSYENLLTVANATYIPGSSSNFPPFFVSTALPNGALRTTFDNPSWIVNRALKTDVNGTLNYAVSVWLQFNLSGQTFPIAVQMFSPGGQTQWQMFFAGTANLYLLHGAVNIANVATGGKTGFWNLYTAAYNDTTRTAMLCINATCTTTPNTPYANWNSTVFTPYNIMSGGNAFSGLVYNARFFNNSITQQDVFNLYYLDTHSSVCDSPSTCSSGVCLTNGLSNTTYVCNSY